MAEFEVLREELIAVDIPTKRLLLAPIDVFCLSSNTYLTWPMFFNYDVNGQRIVESLKKVVEKYPLLCGRIVSDAETRYAIEMDATKEGAHGFPFTEVKSEMSIAEAVLNHSQIKVESADFPCFPDMPFFMEKMNVEAALKGEEPLVRVKLTHFSDGCSLNVTIEHLVMDGLRCLELIRDLTLAYRGKDIPDRDHDRSYTWPDQMAKHYSFLGDEVAKLPRTATQKVEEPGFLKFPGMPCQTELLYFSKETLEEMKAIAKPFLDEGDFVSSNDVLLAFCWMLVCELISQKHPVTNGTELGVGNTVASCPIEYTMNNIDAIPKNYCGNAVLMQFLATQGVDFEGKSLPECLALLAGIVRKTLTSIKNQPEAAAQAIMAYYMIVSTGALPQPTEGFRVSLTNLVKTPVADLDFGDGAPVLAHVTVPMPLIGPLMVAGPAPGGADGILVYAQFLGFQLEILKNSALRKHFAPGMKQLYSSFTVDELTELFNTKK